jgi:PAS domain S-box-containing protein
MDSSEGTELQSSTDTRNIFGIVNIAGVLAASGFIVLAIARIAAGAPGGAPLLIIGGVISLLTIWVNHKGHEKLAGTLLICAIAGIALYLMLSSDGTHNAALLTFPGILMLASLTLRRRVYVVIAVLIVLIPAFVGILEIRKAIVTPYSSNTDLLGLLDITVILLMTAAAVDLMTTTLEESSSRARASEARFRLLFNNSSQSIAVFGSMRADGVPEKIIEVNDSACKQLGYTHEELMRMHPSDMVDPEGRRALAEVLSTLRTEGNAVCESMHRTKDGKSTPVELSLQLFDMDGEPAIIANARDITESKRADGLIRSALREKEILLREIHHRVKNNMQVISSLLNLQASKTTDPVTKAMLEESRQRVRSIAIIHERLYNSANLTNIDFAVYLKSLADELWKSFGRPEISCVLDLEAIPFEIDKAIPTGLIVNELLTNSLKHAFPPPATKGTVSVHIHSIGDQNVELVVKDDGVGFPAGTDISSATTMGLAIVRTLVEQMRGTLTMDTSQGTTCTIRFRLEKKSDTPPRPVLTTPLYQLSDFS